MLAAADDNVPLDRVSGQHVRPLLENAARGFPDPAHGGPGFPDGFAVHAFERFQRGSGGAGLGLAVVRAIAEAHGGDAVADNLADGGARVRVRLPG